VWEPPHKFENKIVNGFLGGWNFTGTIFARTGLPYTVLDYNTFFPNYWTGVIPGQPLGPGATYGAASGCSNPNVACFDPNAFVDTSTTPLADYPTQRRNQYRGPGFFNANFSPSKSFNLTEQVKLRVGANFYNVFNNVNFYLPNAYLSTGDPGVGHI
jgi:hypothetical protein